MIASLQDGESPSGCGQIMAPSSKEVFLDSASNLEFDTSR